MIVLKLSFFVTLASLVEPFLKEFQTEDPMVPYLYDDLVSLTKKLMNMVLKPGVMKVTQDKDLIALDLENVEKLLTAQHVDIGFSSKAALSAVPEKEAFW